MAYAGALSRVYAYAFHIQNANLSIFYAIFKLSAMLFKVGVDIVQHRLELT